MAFQGYCQRITVFDKNTRLPIADVAIFNTSQQKFVTTNVRGQVDISIFDDEERIIIDHLTHIQTESTKAVIIAAGNRIFLEAETRQLDEVVLSAAKWKQRKEEVSHKVVSVNQADVQFTNPQTAADLLTNSGKVFVQKSQLGGGSPMIRGFSANRLLISVDGVRMNNAIFRSGNLQNVISIDPLSVSSTEVILGPGSTIYGSDAVGGALNFFTLRPQIAAQNSLSLTGNVMARYATASNERTSHVDISGSYQKWAWVTSASISDFGDLRMGSHGPDDYLRPEFVVRQSGQDVVVPNPDPRVQRPTGYNQLNFLQKLAFIPNERWDFTLGLYYTTTSDYARYDRLIRYRDGLPRSAEWFYGPQRWFMTNLKVENRRSNSWYDKLRWVGAFQKYQESRHNRDFGNPIKTTRRETVNAYSLNADLEKKLSPSSKLYYGAEFVLNEVGSDAFDFNIDEATRSATSTRYPDGSTWSSIAAYASYQYKPIRNFNIQAGLRYNYISARADFSENNEFFGFPFERATVDAGALTGSVGINWKPNETLQWKLNFSTAFRAPNIDDIGKIFDSEPGLVIVPNPDLKPEYAYNGEIGVLLNFDKIKFDFSTYYTFLEDALVRRPFSLLGEDEIVYEGELSQVFAIQNAARARVYGFEAGMEAQLAPRLVLTSTLSYANGEEELDSGLEAPLRHAPPLFGESHLIWSNHQLKFDFFAAYNGEFSFEDLAPSEQNKPFLYAQDGNGNPFSPSWYTLNFRGQYQFMRGVTGSFSLENITDQRYRPYSSGIAAPGRNMIASLRYSF